ncbi:hypothetical protein [Janibacter anophelis]|uniref:hypothetical protein n=1 Tax=Janibacter anophelis TaxID=319054 RepID=UPI003F806269
MTAVATSTTSAVTITASKLDALIGRLGYDKEFADALANDPKGALASADLTLSKEGLEEYIRTQPERFEAATGALFDRVDSDFLIAMVEPSCA